MRAKRAKNLRIFVMFHVILHTKVLLKIPKLATSIMNSEVNGSYALRTIGRVMIGRGVSCGCKKHHLNQTVLQEIISEQWRRIYASEVRRKNDTFTAIFVMFQAILHAKLPIKVRKLATSVKQKLKVKAKAESRVGSPNNAEMTQEHKALSQVCRIQGNATWWGPGQRLVRKQRAKSWKL